MVVKKKWKLLFTKAAMKDAKKIVAANLQKQTDKVLDVLETDPYQNPPPFEKLVGNLTGCCSRRINIQHRIVYKIEPEDNTQSISSCDEALVKASSGAYELVCEQRAEPATKSQLEMRRVSVRILRMFSYYGDN